MAAVWSVLISREWWNDVPARREVTAPAFGGENLRDLYVTTGQPREGIEEDAGRLFVFSGLGTAGCATHCFRG